MILIYGLWWMGQFSALKTLFILWGVVCAVAGRAAERGRRLGPAWRVRAVTYRIASATTGSSRN